MSTQVQDSATGRAQFIADNIGRHKQFALATVNDDGTPWVVCLNLAYDENYGIIWISDKKAKHSENVANNPNVSICIFSETEPVGDFGLYMQATAKEVLNTDELARLLDIRFGQKGKPVPPPSEFTGESPMRIYYAEPTGIWLNDDRHLKTEINIEELRIK